MKGVSGAREGQIANMVNRRHIRAVGRVGKYRGLICRWKSFEHALLTSEFKSDTNGNGSCGRFGVNAYIMWFLMVSVGGRLCIV